MINTFNSYDSNLQFTFELEQDKRINFLDITLIRNNNMIITNWFRKQTSSDRVINYSSNHPTQQKKNIVFNLFDRAILLSHHEFHHENLLKVIQILKHNNYPSNFIDQNIKIRLGKIRSSFNSYHNGSISNKNKYFLHNFIICLPFVERIFKKLSSSLKFFNISTIPIANIQI